MSTRSTSSNLFSPLRDPESLIRRRNLGEPSSLFDFEEVMSIPHNNQGPPPPNNNGPPPVVRHNGPAPRSMEELCQPSINGRGDDANRHIDKFLEITQHMKQNGVYDDALHLSLFPYSLMHHAIAWYDHLPRNSIHSFDDMMRKFLSKYFPPSMVTKLRNEITKFKQKSHESLFEAWERYKLSIDRCPNHNMLLVTQIDTFYNGLTLSHRDTINAAAGGTFMQKTPEEYSTYSILLSRRNCKERENEATKDKVQNTSLGSTAHVQPPVVQDPIPEPEVAPKPKPKPSIPYPSRLNDQKLREKANNQIFRSRNSLRPHDTRTRRTDRFHVDHTKDYDVDPRVPLILGRPLLRTVRALIDVYGEELTLRVDDEAITFKVGQTFEDTPYDTKR
ncbi:reverse transcriptase domain-containing protein [Tanacetum coccineum]